MLPIIDIPANSTSPCCFNSHYEDQAPCSSSSPIAADKNFFEVDSEKATQPWQPKRQYVIIVDGSQRLLIRMTRANNCQESKESITSAATQENAFIDRLTPIRERLSLSITQLSELFGVTRKSIYDWYDGAEPRAATIRRMEILADALNTIPAEVDLKRLKMVWRIPVSGQSFRTIFNDENLEAESLLIDLKAKLHELLPRMVKKDSVPHKTSVQLGQSHLAEIDRYANFT